MRLVLAAALALLGGCAWSPPGPLTSGPPSELDVFLWRIPARPSS